MTCDAKHDFTIQKGATVEELLQLTDDVSSLLFGIMFVDVGTSLVKVDQDQTDVFRVNDVVEIRGNIAAANRRYTVGAVSYNAGLLETSVTLSPTLPAGTKVLGTIKRVVNTPIDLTGYAISSEIRNRPGGDLLSAFTMTITSAAEGKVTLGMTAVQTAALAWTRGLYDIKFVRPDTSVEYWLCGEVVVEPTITA